MPVHNFRNEIILVWDKTPVNFLKKIFFYKTLNHIVGRNQDVIGTAAHELCVHDLVGLEHVIVDLCVVLLLEVGDDIFSDIFAPVVDIEAQTMHLSCTETNIVSKPTEVRLHMTHII